MRALSRFAPAPPCAPNLLAAARRPMAMAASAGASASEVRFAGLRGVVRTRVGYTGGATDSPTYRTVCAGDGHTEAIQITYDSSVVSYEELLNVFFEEHNPTGRARKVQYKSAIWWHSPAQEAAARAAIAALEARHGLKVITDLAPAQPWFDAEEYHQQFYFKQKAKKIVG